MESQSLHTGRFRLELGQHGLFICDSLVPKILLSTIDVRNVLKESKDDKVPTSCSCLAAVVLWIAAKDGALKSDESAVSFPGAQC